MNKRAMERVLQWQNSDALPEGHSAALMEVGRRVLKGHVGAMDISSNVVMADNEYLVKQAEELQNQEERLKSEFPAATKAMDPEESSDSSSDGEPSGSGHDSEESGVIVDMDECMASGTQSPGEPNVEPDTADKTEDACIENSGDDM
jgi:hypothetical protein